MKDLLRFAEEENADQVFAIIDERFNEDPMLGALLIAYTHGNIDDKELCDEVVLYLISNITKS